MTFLEDNFYWCFRFSGVASGPLVRSSYKAGLLYRKTYDATNQETLPGAYVMVNEKNKAMRDTLNLIRPEVD